MGIRVLAAITGFIAGSGLISLYWRLAGRQLLKPPTGDTTMEPFNLGVLALAAALGAVILVLLHAFRVLSDQAVMGGFAGAMVGFALPLLSPLSNALLIAQRPDLWANRLPGILYGPVVWALWVGAVGMFAGTIANKGARNEESVTRPPDREWVSPQKWGARAEERETPAGLSAAPAGAPARAYGSPYIPHKSILWTVLAWAAIWAVGWVLSAVSMGNSYEHRHSLFAATLALGLVAEVVAIFGVIAGARVAYAGLEARRGWIILEGSVVLAAHLALALVIPLILYMSYAYSVSGYG